MANKINREIDNYFAVIHDLASGNEAWESRPAWLEFAPNNVCNLRCIMCAQADGVPVEVMPKDEAVALLDAVLPHTSLLTPSALSEPMLANMRLIVEKCREHAVFLNFYSNATLLNGERFRAIADRIHKLWISFDCHVPEVFEKLRTPAKFAQVSANIAEILPAATELNIPVGFVSVLMADNAPHLAGLVDYLADLGAVEARADLRVQPMLDNSTRCADSRVDAHYSTEQICGFLDDACARAQARGMLFHVDIDEPFRRTVAPVEGRMRGIMPDLLCRMTDTIKQRYPHFCYMGATYMKIEPNGDVFPCCRGPKELLMGNTKEQSVEEIWNGERYREFRRRMNAGDYAEVCRTCDHLIANPHFKK